MAKEAEAELSAMFVDPEQNPAKGLSQPKCKKAVAVKGRKFPKSPIKSLVATRASKVVVSPHAGGCGPARTGKSKVVANFEEDNNLVEVEISGPDEFLSEGEVGSSSSESDGHDQGSEVEFDGMDKQTQSTKDSASGGESDNQTRSATLCSGQSRSRSRSQGRTPSRSRSWAADRRLTKKKVKRSEYRKSVENKLDHLTHALEAVQQALLSKEVTSKGKEHNLVQNSAGGNAVVISGESETTIYRNAIDTQMDSLIDKTTGVGGINLNAKRVRTSSEDGPIDTSDELIDANAIDNLISEA